MFPARVLRKIGLNSYALLKGLPKTCTRSFSTVLNAQNVFKARQIAGRRYETTKTGQHGKKPGAFEYYSQIAKNIATVFLSLCPSIRGMMPDLSRTESPSFPVLFVSTREW